MSNVMKDRGYNDHSHLKNTKKRGGYVLFDKWCFLNALMAGTTNTLTVQPSRVPVEEEKQGLPPSSQMESEPAPATSCTCKAYPAKLLQTLNFQRQNGSFCDVEITAGGIVIRAHKAVLSASSPYFQAMFGAGLKEQGQSKVELHLISGPVLNALVDFIYTGEIDIVEHNVQELLTVADMLELAEVVSLCTAFLRRELHISNAIGIYRFSEDHHCAELKLYAVNFIQWNFPLICQEEEFFDLPKDQLVSFLNSEHLRVDSEFQVFQAAMRWIVHNVRERRCFVFEVLHHVRLPLLSVCLLDRAIHECMDISLKVALRSIREDLVSKKGSLVPLTVQPRLCAKKDVFVIGGSKRELISTWTRSSGCFTYNSVERFDTFKREWCKATSMRLGRVLPGVVALEGRIFVVGGEEESQILANGECYDPKDDTWNKIASMVVPRCEFGLCALNGTLYAVGGWVGEDIGGSIECYDPAVDEWRLEGDLPEPLFSMGVVSYEGLIYIVGGCTHSRRHLQDLRSYNPQTGEWFAMPPMTVPRSQMGVTVLDRHLYVVGGTNRNHEVLHSVERYSFDDNKWSKVPPMKVGRTCPAVASADGLLYVMGGMQTHEVNFWRAQITISCVECYDPLADSWRECPPLPESRGEAGAVVV